MSSITQYDELFRQIVVGNFHINRMRKEIDTAMQVLLWRLSVYAPEAIKNNNPLIYIHGGSFRWKMYRHCVSVEVLGPEPLRTPLREMYKYDRIKSHGDIPTTSDVIIVWGMVSALLRHIDEKVIDISVVLQPFIEAAHAFPDPDKKTE